MFNILISKCWYLIRDLMIVLPYLILYFYLFKSCNWSANSLFLNRCTFKSNWVKIGKFWVKTALKMLSMDHIVIKQIKYFGLKK